MKIDFLIGISLGDEGKGKVSKILNDKHNYSAIMKFNGSGNAGHAVWYKNKKYTAHYLTSGIYYDKTKIVVGPGCVLNPKEFLEEYKAFDELFNLKGRTFIHPYTHIITDKHIEKDKKENKIGTTNKGTGPCYSDKYKRVGIRAEDVEELKDFILPKKVVTNIDKIRDTFVNGHGNILMEGSQGWWLDIDHGNYPYVTSSHIHPGFAFASFGIPLNKLGTVYGVCKIYDTYVGKSDDIVRCKPKDEKIIRELGNEYGETTKRPRKIGYLNLDNLIEAVNHTGINKLVINKVDILIDAKIFKIIYNKDIIKFENLEDMKQYITKKLEMYTSLYKEDIQYSGDRAGNDIKF